MIPSSVIPCGKRLIWHSLHDSLNTYRLLEITPEEALPATQALHMAALINGADILRVHDVKEAAQTVFMCSKM